MIKILKHITFLLLTLITLMIALSMGGFHIHHHQHEFQIVHGHDSSHHEDHNDTTDHCDGESLFDHLFHNNGIINSKTTVDNIYYISSTCLSSISVNPDSNLLLERHLFPENWDLPDSNNSIVRSQRAPPLTA